MWVDADCRLLWSFVWFYANIDDLIWIQWRKLGLVTKNIFCVTKPTYRHQTHFASTRRNLTATTQNETPRRNHTSSYVNTTQSASVDAKWIFRHFASPNPDCVTKSTLRHFRPKVPWLTQSGLVDAKCIAIQTHRIFRQMSPPLTALMTCLGNSFPQLQYTSAHVQYCFKSMQAIGIAYWD